VSTPAKTRLLYIDDDQALGRLLQKQLERLGYAVRHVGDGASGVAAIAEGGIDVVVLDHYMPGQDGLATLAAIRALEDPPPVIYATGTNDGKVAVAALKAGAADYVFKDMSGEFPALLHAAVEAALEAVQLRRAKQESEQELRASRDNFRALAAERAVLLREVNHRVGNSLQLVASFLHLHAAASSDEEVKMALAEANSRVMAVAQVHRRLFSAEKIERVPLDDYLSGLLGDLSRSTESSQFLDELELKAERIDVDADHAIALGMIVTELVINAVKYAYPGGAGPVRVVLRRLDEARAVLTVEDDGVGLAPAGPKGSGLGRNIVSAMAAKLDGTFCYETRQPGLTARLEFAIAGRDA
jgi:two-component sensor histidine kinase/CheY-like chemotaxis protein